MKIKRHYTSPVTCRATVELEGGFCGSIIDSSAKTVNITSSAQDYEVVGGFTWGTNADGKWSGSNANGTEIITWD